jgi:hypothetical protein
VLTIIGLGMLLSDLLSKETHPDFPCRTDPVERAIHAQDWHSQKVSTAITRLIVLMGLDVVGIIAALAL